jgi:putative ABC transport system ATP-binding protein
MAVHLHHLKKVYVGPDGSVVPVVDIESLNLGDGEQVALIGTSGSGKTTLLHLIAGILAPDSGAILFGNPVDLAADVALLDSRPDASVPPGDVLKYQTPGPIAPELALRGVNVARLSEAHRDVFRGRHIGYIFQTHHLLPGFTALENVLLGMSFTGRSPDKEWATHLLKEVGLSDRMDYRPAKLSVGQQQRVAVARALANRPSLVLADEPTGALDEKNAQQVLDLIRQLCAEVKASLLLVSHDLNIARQLPRVLTLAEINLASAASRSSK